MAELAPDPAEPLRWPDYYRRRDGALVRHVPGRRPPPEIELLGRAPSSVSAMCSGEHCSHCRAYAMPGWIGHLPGRNVLFCYCGEACALRHTRPAGSLTKPARAGAAAGAAAAADA